MRHLITIVLLLTSYGCTNLATQEGNSTTQPPPANTASNTSISASCIGDTLPPEGLTGYFEASQDEALLNSALGQPMQGKLCQGQVYKAKAGSQITIYRAWNSTNPGSQMGNWWAFHTPVGKISQYRHDYEICYQWSPLDKMSICTLKTDINVVIGTGQSAECSQYLNYPVSAAKQLYIEDASNTIFNCETYDGVFDWQVVSE